MNARRELWTWVAACAAGAGAVLLAAGREWVVPGSGGVGAGGAEPPVLTGSGIVSFLSPVALAVLAAMVAVLATGGGARRAVGAVIALCGLGVLAGVWNGTAGAPAAVMEANLARAAAAGGDFALDAFTVRWTWPAVAAAGGLVLLAAGVAAALTGTPLARHVRPVRPFGARLRRGAGHRADDVGRDRPRSRPDRRPGR
ncbi:Trp biosynthesis-associated membrane protein [Planomonospora algeriensis]